MWFNVDNKHLLINLNEMGFASNWQNLTLFK